LDPADGPQDAQLDDGARVHLVHGDVARGGVSDGHGGVTYEDAGQGPGCEGGDPLASNAGVTSIACVMAPPVTRVTTATTPRWEN
jgi:hypothetical protein